MKSGMKLVLLIFNLILVCSALGNEQKDALAYDAESAFVECYNRIDKEAFNQAHAVLAEKEFVIEKVGAAQLLVEERRSADRFSGSMKLVHGFEFQVSKYGIPVTLFVRSDFRGTVYSQRNDNVVTRYFMGTMDINIVTKGTKYIILDSLFNLKPNEGQSERLERISKVKCYTQLSSETTR